MNLLLQPVITDFLFSGDDILHSDFFGNHYWNQREVNVCKTNFCQRKPFSSFFFFQILTRMKVAFRSSEIAFFKVSLILASGNGFLINYKLSAFIWRFFLLVDRMLEIRCKPVFFEFCNSLQGKQLFRLVETDFPSNAPFQRVETDFLLCLLLIRAIVVPLFKLR